MDRVFNKFNQCEHPRVIKNKYTGEYVRVECGKCPYCLIKKSDAKRNLCDFVKANTRFCYFTTLTYNSQYVPKMSLTRIEDYLPEPTSISTHNPPLRSQIITRMLLDPRVKKDVPDFLHEKINQKYLYEHLSALEQTVSSQKSIRMPVFIGDKRPYILRTIPRRSKLHNFKDDYVEELVWLKPDVAEGLKRKNQTEGMNNAFPQFKHLLKYVNYRDYQLFQKRLRKYLFKKNGKYEKIHSYVVSEYSPRTFRPHYHILFFFDSPRVASNLSQAVYQSWRLGRVDTQSARKQASSYLANYVNSVVSLPSVYSDFKHTKNRSRFSKLFGFEFYKKGFGTYENSSSLPSTPVLFSSGDRITSMYPTNSFVRNLFPRFCSYESGFLDQTKSIIRSIRRIYKEFRRIEPFEKETPTNVSVFIFNRINNFYNAGMKFDDLPDYYRIYLQQSRCIKEIMIWTDRLKNKLCRLLYVYKLYESIPYSDDKRLQFIDSYYSASSYVSLVRQLEVQQEMFEKMEFSEELLNLFYVKPDQKRLNHAKILEWREHNYKEIHYFRVKHKVLNDQNNVFCDE